jgi:hypothetical protein
LEVLRCRPGFDGIAGEWFLANAGACPLYVSTGNQARAARQRFMQQPSDIRKIAFLGNYLPSCLRAADFLNRNDTSKYSDRSAFKNA